MLKVVIGTLLSILVATAGFTCCALHWTYSDGQRAGGVAPIRPDRLRVVEGCG
jgi:hypothetical protein